MATERLTPATLGGLPLKTIGEKSPYFKWLFYGESGVGKTRLAGSASEVEAMSPVLYIDLEGGTESLRTIYPDITILPVKTPQQMDKVLHDLKNTDHGFKTVVLDSETEIQMFYMDDIMEDAVAKNDKMEIDVASPREYGKNLYAMRKHVRGFRDLPMHVIFLALSKEEKDAKTGKTKTLPNLTGKFAKEFASILDVVCYYYLKEVKGEPAPRRLMLTTATENIVAKDRSDKLPLIMDAPDMQTIYDLMTQAVDKNSLEANLETARGNISTSDSFAALTS